MSASTSTPVAKKSNGQPSEYGQHYYATVGDIQYADGSESGPQDPSGSREGTSRSLREPKIRVKKYRFQPLKSGKRFRIIHTEWKPAYGDELDWSDRKESFPLPSSLLDIPHDSEINGEYADEPGDVMT